MNDEIVIRFDHMLVTKVKNLINNDNIFSKNHISSYYTFPMPFQYFHLSGSYW